MGNFVGRDLLRLQVRHNCDSRLGENQHQDSDEGLNALQAHSAELAGRTVLDDLVGLERFRGVGRLADWVLPAVVVCGRQLGNECVAVLGEAT